MIELMVQVAGWAAAVMILLAYAMLSAGRLKASSRLCQGLNLAGAAGFVLNSGWNGALPSAALNVIWMGISVYALWRPPR